MASGSDSPQLPRGLIDRTGNPCGKNVRLPSIKGPRDLTLGGVQKKVFMPNIPAQKTKSLESTKDSSSTKKQTSVEKTHNSNSAPAGKRKDFADRGEDGHGRGRCRGSNVIQTHSLLELGPTGKIYKPTGGYAVRGSKSELSTSPRNSIKREKTDEEMKEILDHLLRDDFIDNVGDFEDVTLMPVKLPLDTKIEPNLKPDSLDYTKVRVKHKLMDADNVTKEKPKNNEVQDKSMKLSFREIFTNPVKSEQGQLLYFQLPDMLPGLPLTVNTDLKKTKQANKPSTSTDQDSELESKLIACNLENFKEGFIGKLIIRKSGHVQMLLGNTYLDVNAGTPCRFLQDLACVRISREEGDITVLGHIDQKLMCTPDFEYLLEGT